MIVAALVNRNETVGVIHTGDDAHVDFTRVDELIDVELYARGRELLERISS